MTSIDIFCCLIMADIINESLTITFVIINTLQVNNFIINAFRLQCLNN